MASRTPPGRPVRPRTPASEPTTETLLSCLDGAFSDMDDLRSELQDWRDNLPENLQDGEKAEELDEVTGQIESVNKPDVPKGAEAFIVSYRLMQRKRMSRSQRRDNCLMQLQSIVTAMEAMLLKIPTEHNDHNEFSEFKREVQEAHDEFEGVDFPGMH